MSMEIVRVKTKRTVHKHCILVEFFFFPCRCYRLAILKLLYMCVYIYMCVCIYTLYTYTKVEQIMRLRD